MSILPKICILVTQLTKDAVLSAAVAFPQDLAASSTYTTQPVNQMKSRIKTWHV